MLRRLAMVAACGFLVTTGLSRGIVQDVRNEELQTRLQAGAAHLQRGQMQEAIDELKKALALDPQSAAGHLLLGQAYLGLRSVSLVAEAKAEFQQALDIDPTLLWAHFYLAKVYIDQGRYDRAKERKMPRWHGSEPQAH